jgi:REP element-mobilizing transposase RayT
MLRQPTVLCNNLHDIPAAVRLAVVANAFEQYARKAQEFHVAVGRYVIMPDHIHLFVRGGHDFALTEWIKGLKRTVSKMLVPTDVGFRWQPGFFDHVVRNDESYGQKWEYVRENPVRGGLVSSADDWPYAGEIVVIDRA